MNKNDMIRYVAKETNFTLENAEAAVSAVFDAIRISLHNGDRMILQGIGSFTPITKAARNGRNPQTGEVISIPEKKTYKFKPSQEVIDILNN